MAVVLKCDKCGNVFEYVPEKTNYICVASKSMFTEKIKNIKNYDICPECVEEIKQMFTKE